MFLLLLLWSDVNCEANTKYMPAESLISAGIGRNTPARPKHPKLAGMGYITLGYIYESRKYIKIRTQRFTFWFWLEKRGIIIYKGIEGSWTERCCSCGKGRAALFCQFFLVLEVWSDPHSPIQWNTILEFIHHPRTRKRKEMHENRVSK